MYNVLLAIHIIVTLSLIVIILMQRSASDGMGLSGGSSGSVLSGRAVAKGITHTTSILAALFILTSLGLGVLTAHNHAGEISIMDRLSGKPAAPSPLIPGNNPLQSVPAAPAPAAPAAPSVPRPE